MPATIPPGLAARHEALTLRLAALARQTESFAARRPDCAVPDATRILAEALLFDARPFIGRRDRLPAAAPDYAGLAAQLTTALAGLESYEQRCSFWSPSRKCFVWRLSSGDPLPVARLRPEPVTPPKLAADEAREARAKLAERLAELLREGGVPRLQEALGGPLSQTPPAS